MGWETGFDAENIRLVKDKVERLEAEATSENIDVSLLEGANVSLHVDNNAMQAARGNLAHFSAVGSSDYTDAVLHLCALLICRREEENTTQRSDIRRGYEEASRLLASLTDSTHRSSDITWWASMLAFKQGQYRACRELLSGLALREPSNREVEGLLGVLAQTYASEGSTGLVYAGAALALLVVAGVGIWWFTRSKVSAATGPASLAHATPTGTTMLRTTTPQTGHGGHANTTANARFKPT
jgi:hypothetical protein